MSADLDPPPTGEQTPAEREELLRQIQALYERLEEPEETVRALRDGEVDALVISEQGVEKVYTLRSADRPYRMMIEAMSQGAMTLTADGIILYCNRCFAGMLRAPLERVTGSFLQQFVRPEDLPAFEALLADGRRGSSHGELRLARQDGTSVPIYLAVSGLDLDGVEGLCLVVTDLTAQKRAAEAEAASRAKDRFLATLSHELRTPLTPVLAVISKLEGDSRLPADVLADLARARRNVELEALLIDDILDLTRIAQGRLALRRQGTDVHQLLEQAIQICCEESAVAGRLEVERDFAAGALRLLADPVRLTQVFWNLLNNAVKFTPPGGRIAVRSRREEAAPDGPQLLIEVADTGIGIDAGSLGSIFGAFDQGQPDISRRYGGLGLGLAISKAIVELHGGTLAAHSAGKDRGTTLAIRLPLAEAPAEAAALPARSGAGGAQGDGAGAPALHLLLVEDHADTAEAMADLLRGQGYRVTVAATVAAALAAAEAARRAGNGAGIDLVVSDLGLPDGSGLDLMRELAKRYGLKGIALSGYGMEDDVRKSREAGFAEHLTKPVDLHALRAAVLRAAGAAG
jgi:PAS domain S-box-containing protein